MNDDSKEKKYGDQYLELAKTRQKNSKSSQRKFPSIWSENSIFIATGAIQILTGMSMVAITILGLLTPLWLAAGLSMLGSISSMFGVYLIFHALSKTGSFDSLMNQSIKRAIRDQN